MYTRLIFASILAAITAIASASDEALVTTTYAKLAFATRVAALRQLLLSSPSEGASSSLNEYIASRELEVGISNLRTGPIDDLLSLRYSDLVTKPSGEVLEISSGTWVHQSVDEQGAGVYAALRWKPAQYLGGEDWDVPLKTVLDTAEPTISFLRYAAFSVDVRFEGKSRSYLSLFLFGTNLATGSEEVLPLDSVVGNSALGFFVRASVFPGLFAIEPYRSKKEVNEFLNGASERAVGCETGGSIGVCCNPASMRCGVRMPGLLSEYVLKASKSSGRRLLEGDCSNADFANANDVYTTSDSAHHIAGQHEFNSVIQSSCSYTNYVPPSMPCMGHCSTAVPTLYMTDTGLTSDACHVTGITQQTGTADGLSPTCKAATAGAVRSCLFCTCGVSVSITLSPFQVSFPADAVWTVSRSKEVTCPQQSCT